MIRLSLIFLVMWCMPGPIGCDYHESAMKRETNTDAPVSLASENRAASADETAITSNDPRPQGVLNGVLVSEENAPLRGETVFLVRRRNLLYNTPTTTDDRGAFSFGPLPPGDYAVAVGPLFRGQRVAVEPGKTTFVTLKADRDPSLTGKVTAEHDAVGDGVVTFLCLTPERSRLVWPPPIVETRTTKDGRYTAVGILPGTYWVGVWPQPPKDYSQEKPQTRTTPFVSFFKIVRIEAGQKELDLDAPECVLEGTVTDHTGKPVSGAMALLVPRETPAGIMGLQAHLLSASAHTDKDGAFRFGHVDRGAYDIAIVDSGSAQLKPGVTVGQKATSIEWRLEKPVTVEGAVFGDTPYEPYVVVVSEKHSKLRSLMDHEFLGFPDAPPRFMPSIVYPPGRYKVFALAKSWGTTCEGSVVDFNGTARIDLRLAPDGAVQVTLKGNPKAIAGRTVRLLNDGGSEIPRLYDPLWTYDTRMAPAVVLPTASDGVTTIWGLRPGRYEVRVDGADIKARFEVKAGKTSRVTLELE